MFPMSDIASARLMKIKARRLCSAGLLPEALKSQIDGQANRLLLLHDRPPAPHRPAPSLSHHG
jgi:hypothetical protein